MKAIRVREFGAPEVMRVEDVELPALAAGQVLVKVEAAGVNPVDTYIRSGNYAKKPALPYTPGNDGAGVVNLVGAGVSSCAPGDRVYFGGSATGSYAELALCLESQVHPLPANVSSAEGAALGVPYGSAYRALFQRAHAEPGETVLVHGASGGVGLASVQLAAARGLRVIATAGSAAGRELVTREGASSVLDHSTAGYLDKVMELTGGKGVDVIVETHANVNLGKDLKVLAQHGRVVVVGSRGTVEIDPRDTMGREATITGMSIFNTTESEGAITHAAIYAGLKNGTLRPVIREEMPLEDAPRAHRMVMEPGAGGKIVLLP